MHVLQCSNGHFFDGDKYSACPHCGALVETGEAKKKEKSDSFFGRIKSKTERSGTSYKDTKNQTPAINSDTEQPYDYDKTEMYIEEAPDRDLTEMVSPRLEQNANGNLTGISHYSDEKAEGSQVRHNFDPGADMPVPNAEAVSDGGKTVGFFSFTGNSSASGNSTPNSETQTGNPSGTAFVSTEPIVGWLVCLKGKYFGSAFVINAGRNSVGRDVSNRIAIQGDNSVSHIKHLWITYEPKKREFYVQPGESSGLVYLNGENIMSSEKLAAYDQLEIGAGTYMLVPLCNENFTWEDYI